jgi:hypothetical protein
MGFSEGGQTLPLISHSTEPSQTPFIHGIHYQGIVHFLESFKVILGLLGFQKALTRYG